MPMIAIVKKSQVEYKQVPAGTHIAIIDRIIDLGTHETIYKDVKGNIKSARRISLRFEIPGQKLDDGTSMTLYRDLNFNLGNATLKTDLRKYSEAILGKEINNLDLNDLLGQACMVQVVHTPGKADKTKIYANVTGVMKIPDGIPSPIPSSKPVLFCIDEFDKEFYESLPEWIQKKIALPAGINFSDNSANDEKSTEDLLA